MDRHRSLGGEWRPRLGRGLAAVPAVVTRGRIRATYFRRLARSDSALRYTDADVPRCVSAMQSAVVRALAPTEFRRASSMLQSVRKQVDVMRSGIRWESVELQRRVPGNPR
ncbi:hypothetical protein C9J85_05315 [Haloferax sp. wsp5]|nr:hypothetical protein C9J85_05315 [Haloferax sp. wsp5]